MTAVAPRSVMLVLDGVASAGPALDTAIALCRRSGGVLVLTALLDEARLNRPGLGGIGSDASGAAIMEALSGRLSERVDAESERCADLARTAGIRIETQAVRGDAAQALLAAVPACDLVVVPNTIRRRAGEDSVDLDLALDVGSFAAAAARPVLLVADAALGDGAALVAYDGSVQSARAVAAAVQTGLLADRAATVVTVASAAAGAGAVGAVAATYLRRHGVAVELRAEESDAAPGEALADVAARVAPALVVMGATSAAGIAAFLFGSNTRTLISRVAAPILASA